MAIRKEVQAFVSSGPLPDSSASEGTIAERQDQLRQISRPVTSEEAALLMTAFGTDDCFGLSWQLLHLVESTPGGVPMGCKPSEADNEWLRRLWDRSHR